MSLADLFAQPIRLKTRHKDLTSSYGYGSYFGLFLTFVGFTIWMTYFGIITEDMFE